MQTLFKPLALVALLALGLAQQNPWTNWGIYADSTGNGQTPVHGTLQCPDTFWLVVDTSGMAAAGITGWKWFDGNTMLPSNVVFPAPPGPFPPAGLANRKVGVDLDNGGSASFILRVYFSNGDSASHARSVRIKGGGFLMLNSYSPSVVCPSTQVTFDFQIPADIDSFIVSYGPNPTDTIKNRTTFQLTAPGTPGTWTITADVYVCGSLNQMTTSIPISSPPSYTPLNFTASPYYVCPGSTVTLDADPATLAGITSLSINIIDPNSTIAHTATSFPVTWTVPAAAAAGTYDVQVTATYACGPVSQVYPGMFQVYGPSSLTAPNLFGPNRYCPGTEATISISPTQGLLSVDIGNDGTWDHVGLPFGFFRHTFPTIPPGGVPIKVRQDIGCFNREDVLSWNPTTPALPQINFMSNGFWCPGGSVEVYGFASNFTVGAPGNYITWQASWLNGGNPFNGTRIDTTLPAPPSAGTFTITATVHNGCGSAPQPYIHQLTTPPIFPTFPTIIGAACPTTGGVVRITFPNYTLADSIRYYLPNGSSVTLMPGDTLTYTVPPNTSAASIVAQEFIGTCQTLTQALSIPISGEKASFVFVPSSGSYCPGTTSNLFAQTTLGTQEVRVYQGTTLLLSQAPTPSGIFSSVFLSFTAPSTPGTYNYTLVAIGCGGNDTAQYSVIVSGNGAVANFTAPATACVGQPVTFQRSGNNTGIVGAQWNFGDSNILTDTSLTVTHTYTTAGTYNVFLNINSSCGYTSYSQTIKIYGGPPSLSGPTVNTSGATITYSVSATDYDSVKWVFGDGNTALGLSGTHTYTANGTYTVQAIAYNGCGTDTLRTTVTITAAGFSSSVAAGSWQLFPNPAQDAVTLTSSTYAGPVRVQVYDLHGRLVREAQLEAVPGRLSVSGLPAGLYHLRLHTLMGTETLRLLVE